MGYITLALHTIVLIHAASIAAQFMPQMPFRPQFPQVPQMPQMPGVAMPQVVQTMPGQPMHMGMPMPGGMPMGMPPMGMQPKMPMVVMPYHSKSQDKKSSSSGKNKKKKKKRRPKKYKSESCSSDESGSSDESDRSDDERRSSKKRYMRSHKGKEHRDKHKRRREVLTPVISYVTKDGYVVYQKKVKKDKAKDWLDLGKSPSKSKYSDDESSFEKVAMGRSAEKMKEEIKRYQKIKKNRLRE